MSIYDPISEESRELTNSIGECVQISLSYELKRHYDLRGYPRVISKVHIVYPAELSIGPRPAMTSYRKPMIKIYVNVLEVYYSNEKDHFIMSLRSEDTVLKWLQERATIVANGIVKQLDRRCRTLFEKPEDVIVDITNAMRRL